MWFGLGIVFYTFPNCSFVNSDSIPRGVPVVKDHEGVLQGCVDWEGGCSSDNLVIFQDSIDTDRDSVPPQMSCKYSRGWGNFVEIGDRVVYYSLSMGS